MATPIKVSDDSFQNDVLNSDKPVLVDFWAAWCGPCRMVAPFLEEIAAEQADSLTVAKLDVDSNPQVPGRYGVVSIPTLMLFKGGEVVARLVGARPKNAIMAEVQPFLAKAAAD